MVAPRGSGTGVTTGKTTTQSSSLGTKGSATGAGGMFGGGGGSGRSTTPSGGGASPKGPGASQAAAKASAAKSAPKSPTGSGQIGSKGGGASTQKPGAGTGPAKASSIKAPTSKLQSFTAGSNLAANRQSSMNKVSSAPAKPTVGQGFIKNQTQNLKDAYSQYRSPPGLTRQAPKQATPPQNFSSPQKQPGITQPKQATPPKNFASPQRPSGPTVQAGTSWTNPNGVPDNVKKALAARGFAPDGTRLPTQAIAQDPALRGLNEQAKKNYKAVTGPGGMVGGMVYNRPDLGPRPAAPAPKVQTPAQNASYFGDIKQPALAGWNSVFQREWVDPVKRALTGTPAAPPAPSMADVYRGIAQGAGVTPPAPSMSDVYRNIAQAGSAQTVADPRAGFISPNNVGPAAASVPAPMNMRPGFTADRPSALDGIYRDSLTGAQPTGPTIGQMIGDEARQIARGWGRIGSNIAGAVGAGINAIADLGLSPGDVVSDGRGLSVVNADGSLSPQTGQRATTPMASQGTSYANPVAARKATTDTLAARTARSAGAAPGMPAPTGQEQVGQEQVGPTVPTRSISPASAQNAYKVQRGDTLSKIAAKNGTTVQAIAEANGITNPNKIAPGQTLNIPTDASIQPMGGPEGEYDGWPAKGESAFERLVNRSIAAERQAVLDAVAAARNPSTTQPPTTDPATDDQASVAPSQGENVPPSQLDRYPQDARELRNRITNDLDEAKRNARNIPRALYDAIVNGDFRAPQMIGDMGNGGRNWERGGNVMVPYIPYAGSFGGSRGGGGSGGSQQGILPASNEQMQLIYNTFV